MPTITKPRQWMLDTLDDPELIVRDRITDHSRWSVIHELIFKYEGKLYRTYYSCGATEYQDESPWEYEENITSKEVKVVPSIDYADIVDTKPIRRL